MEDAVAGDVDTTTNAKRDRVIENTDETVERVRQFLERTIEKMGLRAEVHEYDEDPDIVLEIQGDDAAIAIGKKGVTLDALQLLCNRVARKTPDGMRSSIVLDAEGYRARREQSLENMARKLGAQAVKEGQVITLEPMSARDRRVIHMALARFPGVSTQSEGEGLERRLKIIPMPERK
jgi:spoIIIJ-associated protein